MSETIWWGEDSYWSEALDHIENLRREDNNFITINLAEIDDVMFNEDGPAYRLLEAMKSVLEHEAYDMGIGELRD